MITFLKLGGSLITDKNNPHTARPDVISRIGKEIFDFWQTDRSPLLIGHGSGSFGHVPAKRYGTRKGVYSQQDWAGFAEVHAEAVSLNHIVTSILRECGLPVISFVPMDEIKTVHGKISRWDITNIVNCYSAYGLIPLIFGDTIFDEETGGTILSTEDLFMHLCHALPEKPRILLAGLEEGVWQDFPQKTKLIEKIHASENEDERFIGGSASTDVTGGMYEKVRIMKELVRKDQALSVSIFSGERTGNITKELKNIPTGTSIVL